MLLVDDEGEDVLGEEVIEYQGKKCKGSRIFTAFYDR